MAEKRGQYVYNDDGTVSTLVSIAGAEDSGGGALGTNVKQSEIIVPVDVQARYAKTIQTHNGVTVPPTTGSVDGASWIDCEGFDKLSFTSDVSLAVVGGFVDVLWSNDGSSQHGTEFGSGATSASVRYMQNTMDIKARFVKIRVRNTGGSPITVNASVYLKA